MTNEVKWLGQDILDLWPGLASVAVVESTRQDFGDMSGKVSTERRYFISSHDGTNAQLIGEGVRSHWGVENGLHWRLDVAMNEDSSRIRMDNGAENFSRLRRIALNKLKRWQPKKANGKTLKVGIAIKQQMCGWSRESLLQALFA